MEMESPAFFDPFVLTTPTNIDSGVHETMSAAGPMVGTLRHKIFPWLILPDWRRWPSWVNRFFEHTKPSNSY